MQLPLTLAGGLRAAFADVVSSPLPERLTALLRRLDAHCTESSGEGRDDGASTTKWSSRQLRSLTAALFEDEQLEHHRMRKRRSHAANRRA
jgi:hypothetical protein